MAQCVRLRYCCLSAHAQSLASSCSWVQLQRGEKQLIDLESSREEKIKITCTPIDRFYFNCVFNDAVFKLLSYYPKITMSSAKRPLKKKKYTRHSAARALKAGLAERSSSNPDLAGSTTSSDEDIRPAKRRRPRSAPPPSRRVPTTRSSRRPKTRLRSSKRPSPKPARPPDPDDAADDVAADDEGN